MLMAADPNTRGATGERRRRKSNTCTISAASLGIAPPPLPNNPAPQPSQPQPAQPRPTQKLAFDAAWAAQQPAAATLPLGVPLMQPGALHAGAMQPQLLPQMQPQLLQPSCGPVDDPQLLEQIRQQHVQLQQQQQQLQQLILQQQQLQQQQQQQLRRRMQREATKQQEQASRAEQPSQPLPSAPAPPLMHSTPAVPQRVGAPHAQGPVPQPAPPAGPGKDVRREWEKKKDSEADKERDQQRRAQFTANTSSERPCDHNNWDNVRVKKGQITLRCRDCQLQWKTETERIRKCPQFFQGECANGVACPMPHIHRYKQGEAKRREIWGDKLIGRRKAEEEGGEDDDNRSCSPVVVACGPGTGSFDLGVGTPTLSLPNRNVSHFGGGVSDGQSGTPSPGRSPTMGLCGSLAGVQVGYDVAPGSGSPERAQGSPCAAPLDARPFAAALAARAKSEDGSGGKKQKRRKRQAEDSVTAASGAGATSSSGTVSLSFPGDCEGSEQFTPPPPPRIPAPAPVPSPPPPPSFAIAARSVPAPPPARPPAAALGGGGGRQVDVIHLDDLTETSAVFTDRDCLSAEASPPPCVNPSGPGYDLQPWRSLGPAAGPAAGHAAGPEYTESQQLASSGRGPVLTDDLGQVMCGEDSPDFLDNTVSSHRELDELYQESCRRERTRFEPTQRREARERRVSADAERESSANSTPDVTAAVPAHAPHPRDFSPQVNLMAPPPHQQMERMPTAPQRVGLGPVYPLHTPPPPSTSLPTAVVQSTTRLVAEQKSAFGAVGDPGPQGSPAFGPDGYPIPSNMLGQSAFFHDSPAACTQSSPGCDAPPLATPTSTHASRTSPMIPSIPDAAGLLGTPVVPTQQQESSPPPANTIHPALHQQQLAGPSGSTFADPAHSAPSVYVPRHGSRQILQQAQGSSTVRGSPCGGSSRPYP
eukprot:TRINITY_DN55195_c0_g1_i1.p1 TRINITY_DN55195_c0_g1~~TRINITY_DN55195_c0_g1_i1.p1  ORF type:complete len:981 (+),score=236.38 TRINITY_DN55195_c0_g1_i1:159-2945(+)